MFKKSFFEKESGLRHSAIVIFYCMALILILYFPRIVRHLSKTEKKVGEIYFSGFSDVIPEEVFREFEQKTGIRVHTKYCDSDFEMMMQLCGGGDSGYDLVSPTSYMAEKMRGEGLLEYIEISKLKNFEKIQPCFIKDFVNDGFTKIIPISWSVHGLGFKKTFFDNRGIRRPNSFAYVLEPEKVFNQKALNGRFKKYRVCISDDPQELIFIASIFLFGDVLDFSEKRLAQIHSLLVKQRRWTLAYTTSDITYYLLHCVPVLLCLGAHAKKALDANPAYDFIIPKEGGLLTVQNLCMPKGAQNKEAVYKFIDFILEAQTQADLFDQTGFSPVNFDAKELVDPRFANHSAYFVTVEDIEKFHKLNNILPTVTGQELMDWVRVT